MSERCITCRAFFKNRGKCCIWLIELFKVFWYGETKNQSMVVGWYFHESYAKINDNSVPVDTPSNRCIAYIQIKWYTKLYVHGYWEIFIEMAVILIAIETPKIYTMVLWIANE